MDAASAPSEPRARPAPDEAGDPLPPPAIGTGERPDRAALLAVPLRSRRRLGARAAELAALPGVGPKLSEAAAGVGLKTLGDLIEHVPHSHQDRAEAIPIAELPLGGEATVIAEVRSARVRPTRRRNLRILEATVADATGPITAIWFNQAWLAERLRPGVRMLLNGRVDRKGLRVDAYEFLESAAGGDEVPAGPLRSGGEVPPGIHTRGLVPVHPAGEGVRPQRLREWAWQSLALAGNVPEPLPAELRARCRLAGACDARIAAHFPRSVSELEEARRRLAFEELFLHQAALALRRRERDAERPALPLEGPGDLVSGWIGSLPFEPTSDQRRAFAEIDADLALGRPMQRLLMGEVGSGKTVVALYAMLRAIDSGGQAAMMAPTETLAQQHFSTLETLLAGLPLPAALLTGSTPPAARRRTLGLLATGELGLIVGTHALIEPEVAFARLAVAVVDEQHRFGVAQRRALDSKGPEGVAPHALHMTATPIPRTLSLTAYGDLDTTALTELPAGRRPVKTWVVDEGRRDGAYGFIRDQIAAGRQAFIVCPRVSESEGEQAKAAVAEGDRLARGEFREQRVQVLHGQMRPVEKAEAMERFASGEADVLVATSVIEVGIDVPNASVMVIEDGDRYGLSQLHQLRGRIGRGTHESFCVLFADPETESARARLAAIESERDGFSLAEVDLSLRGEGEVLGTRQSGLPRFRVATLPEDAELLVAAREELLALLERHATLDAPALGPLIDIVRERFGDERAEPIAA
jgi:ATP-dependent DNA helicase RecG